MLNVARGGTLVQDIASQVPGALSHQLEVPPHQPMEFAHEVWIDKDTLLATLMRERLSDTDTCNVNSRHHQAVRQVAPGLIASATAPDGVIEAIEDPVRRSSAWASSGIPKTSFAPANSGRCSKDFCKRPRDVASAL